jgi:hypothetical protein
MNAPHRNRRMPGSHTSPENRATTTGGVPDPRSSTEDGHDSNEESAADHSRSLAESVAFRTLLPTFGAFIIAFIPPLRPFAVVLGLLCLVAGLILLGLNRRRWAGRRSSLAVLAASLVVVITGCLMGPSATASKEIAAPTSGDANLAPSLRSDFPPSKGLSCSDIGGVFEAHGTDGRGDCVSADSSPACHVRPELQDSNYLAEVTMTPPFANGTVNQTDISGSPSNKQCWKLPKQPSDDQAEGRVTSKSIAPAATREAAYKVLEAGISHYRDLLRRGQSIVGDEQYPDGMAGLNAMDDPTSAAARFRDYRQSPDPERDLTYNVDFSRADSNFSPSNEPEAISNWQSHMSGAQSDLASWIGVATGFQISEKSKADLDAAAQRVQEDLSAADADAKEVENGK